MRGALRPLGLKQIPGRACGGGVMEALWESGGMH